MQGKVCLLTGATNGFGLITATELARRGATVVLVARNEARGEAAQRHIEEKTGNRPTLIFADLLLQANVKRVAAEFRAQHNRLDVLLNNAGYAWLSREETSEGFEKTFALNYLAYFTLTLELIDLLIASSPARIINTASEAHRWEPISFDNLQGERRFRKSLPPMPLMYGYSNVMRIMLTYELAERLQETAVTANTLCPGFVPVERSQSPAFVRWLSRLTSRLNNARSPEEAAKTFIFLAADEKAAALNGTYHEGGTLMKSAPQTYETAVRGQLWDETLKLAGFSHDPIATFSDNQQQSK